MAEHMKARAVVVFKGTVQGVFFRANTLDFARESGLTGWVRNERDRSVKAVFEGERAHIERVISECINEQPMAKVDDCDVKWEPWSGEFKEFRITK
jgi:acylphosphatase